MRIFITGHKGFVGSHLKKYLETTYKGLIEWEGYDLLDNKNDICDKYNLDFHIRKFNPDVVIHMAAKAGVTESKIYPEEYINSNIIGTQNVVELCEKHNVQKLIFFSSSSVFGQRTDETPVEEDFLKEPISLYGITKLAGEHIVNASSINQTFIIRPFTIYGSEGRPDGVIYKWINQAKSTNCITVYGDEQSYRGYIHVRSLIETIIDKMCLSDTTGLKQHEDFNLGGSEKVFLKDITDVFEEFFPTLEKEYIPRPKEDILGQTANTSYAFDKLGFNPPPMFKDELRKILNKEVPQNEISEPIESVTHSRFTQSN